ARYDYIYIICSESASLIKRDAPAELEKIAKYFQDHVDNLKKVRGPDLVNKQTRAHFQPMVEKLHEQLKPLSSNTEDHIKPLAASVQTHVEDVLKFVADQTKAILPPQ
uniref:Antifreeze protein type IV n=1 Tax=Cyprinus carpio TaxID=7962 RepID=A0A8C2G613_CYPCA